MLTRRLILRLSSLGDIILASSVLEVQYFGQSLKPAANHKLEEPSQRSSEEPLQKRCLEKESPKKQSNEKQFNDQFDWVISGEFCSIIQNHPRIGKVYPFDRRSGFRNWVKLCRQVWEMHYDEVFDLHRSLRTLAMKILFYYWGLRERQELPRWTSISKQRCRFYLYCFFKSAWPKKWRPTPWVQRYTELIGGDGLERPSLRHLLDTNAPSQIAELRKANQGYLCIMPSSRWAAKNWPVAHYLELISKLPYFPVILGTQNDSQSIELVKTLKDAKIPHYSGIGNWSLAETAHVLSHSVGYLGGDTGLAHLAEAIGVPARVIFGPTTPDIGFSPWRVESRSMGSSLGCRPCGKDGRYCYRLFGRFACLKDLPPKLILENW